VGSRNAERARRALGPSQVGRSRARERSAHASGVRGEARLSAAQEPQRWRLASKRLIAFVVTDMAIDVMLAMLVRDDVVRTV
jgi:hypothetical protein